MAIFIPGMTCPICGTPISRAEDAFLFPAMVRNPKDPLFMFSDAAVLLECAKEHPLFEAAVRLAERQTAFLAEPKVCSLSGVSLTPETAVAIGHLTSTPGVLAQEFAFRWYSRDALKAPETARRLSEALDSLASEWDAAALAALRAELLRD